MSLSYREFLERSDFSKAELIAFAHGHLIEDRPPTLTSQLPTPPMLMFDRVVSVEHAHRRGRIVAELDVDLDAWFFQCHFKSDPVMPGCLGVDAVWQLLGFYCVLRGGLGSGRALGVGDIAFEGQIRPHDALVTYDLEILRFQQFEKSGACMALANATVAVDGEVVYTIQKAKSGLFVGIDYPDYPAPSPPSKGGRM